MVTIWEVLQFNLIIINIREDIFIDQSINILLGESSTNLAFDFIFQGMIYLGL